MYKLLNIDYQSFDVYDIIILPIILYTIRIAILVTGSFVKDNKDKNLKSHQLYIIMCMPK